MKFVRESGHFAKARGSVDSTFFRAAIGMPMPDIYQLRCRECGKLWGNAPRSFCEDCFSPLEVSYDYDALKSIAVKADLARRDFNMWRYAEFLPLPEGFQFPNSVGGTPLVASRHLAKKWGLRNLYFKNDAVCFPSLSFKDRVVATALAAAQRFAFKTVGCSSTGNLANAGAAQSAQQGFDSCVFIPADLEPAKILNTAVYGARIVRINGNYDHVNRLCAQIADRFQWGLVNVNLRPYYSEGSKTHGFEIAEQLGWRLPDNVVVGRRKAGEIFWSAGDRLLSDFERGQTGTRAVRTAEAGHHRTILGHW